VPIGYLITVLLATVGTALAIRPPHPRHSGPFRVSYVLSFVVSEQPFIAFYWLLASTLLAFAQGDLDRPATWVVAALAGATCAALPILIPRELRAAATVDAALAQGLGPDWRAGVDDDLRQRLRRRLPWVRIIFAPWRFGHRDVERVSNLSYGDAGRRNRLDVYRHRSHPVDAPTLVYFHGGAFRGGSKRREARPLLYRLASQGWVCVSATYRRGRAARFPDHHIDAKRAIAWVRKHGPVYGVDPATIFVAGSSAGGHLAAMVALTPGDPAFQPGFEDADTSVAAAISFYGYYGRLSAEPASSPLAHLNADAPPFFVAHGDQDTLVIVEDARHFVDALRDASRNPVVYAELAGGQHGFDLFHSIRFEAVVDGVETFAAWVRSRPAAPKD
jgi:acetyl esterase/lipase